MSLKNLALIALASSAVSAVACPDLTGTFVCGLGPDGDTSHAWELTMTQEVVNDVTHFSGTSGGATLTIPADNLTHKLPEDSGVTNGTRRAWCEGSFLRVQSAGDLYDAGKVVGKIRSESSYTTSVANDLVEITKVVWETTEDGEMPYEYVDVCKRKN
jgi:hypothetical protein